MGDDYTYDLFWHALNYRTAGPKEAEAMWQELRACSERIADYTLESALAKSASREAALVEKVKLAEEALKEISLNYWRPGDDFCHPEGCGSPGVANAALAKIKEAS